MISDPSKKSPVSLLRVLRGVFTDRFPCKLQRPHNFLGTWTKNSQIINTKTWRPLFWKRYGVSIGSKAPPKPRTLILWHMSRFFRSNWSIILGSGPVAGWLPKFLGGLLAEKKYVVPKPRSWGRWGNKLGNTSHGFGKQWGERLYKMLSLRWNLWKGNQV